MDKLFLHQWCSSFSLIGSEIESSDVNWFVVFLPAHINSALTLALVLVVLVVMLVVVVMVVVLISSKNCLKNMIDYTALKFT